MRNRMTVLATFFVCAWALISCNKENDKGTESLALSITGLEDLGSTARYEGWIMVNGSPVSTGVFSVNSSGQLSQSTFQVDPKQLLSATAFILTIEPYPDPTPAPSDVHLLGGDFSASTAALSVGHPAALNTSFLNSSGKYVLATPTTASTNDETSGLWFIDLTGGAPVVGLNMPVLPSGWRYEGWALIEGKPISTGIFSNATGPDQAAPFSGPSAAPPFPGEDFVLNAPAGSTFPTNLSGGLAVVSVEPFPDNSPAPFLLKPLIATIPTPASDHLTYNMTLNAASFPSGTATK